MTILSLNQHSAGQKPSIASRLRWLAAWLTTPPSPRPDKRRSLPNELTDAEDWLLADLGLAEPDDALPLRAPTSNADQGRWDWAR